MYTAHTRFHAFICLNQFSISNVYYVYTIRIQLKHRLYEFMYVFFKYFDHFKNVIYLIFHAYIEARLTNTSTMPGNKSNIRIYTFRVSSYFHIFTHDFHV